MDHRSRSFNALTEMVEPLPRVRRPRVRHTLAAFSQPNLLSSPIREACLDERVEPNETAHKVQEALDAQGGCRKTIGGFRCGGTLVFDPKEVMCL